MNESYEQIVHDIQDVFAQEDLNDFMRIEAILRIFETYGVGVHDCHDFG